MSDKRGMMSAGRLGAAGLVEMMMTADSLQPTARMRTGFWSLRFPLTADG